MLIIRYILLVLLAIAPGMATLTHAQEKVDLAALQKEIKNSSLPDDEQHKLIDRLIIEAKKQGNDSILCQAYNNKIVLAYNSYNAKEAGKWIKLLEPIVIKTKQYDYYFRGKQCFIDLMLVMEGELEKGEEEAKKMLAEAEKLDHKMGIVLAHLCLSHAYTLSYREKLTAQELEKAYQVSLTANKMWITKEILHALVQTYGKLEDYPNQLKYLKKQITLLRERSISNPEEISIINSYMNLSYISFVTHYIQTENPGMAKRYLDSSTQYFSSNYPNIFQAFYYDGSLKYYEYVEDHKNALWSVDSLLKYASINTDQYIYESIKARLLWKTGALKEAADLYERTIYLQDSLASNVLNKQIQQIQQIDENNKMQLEKEKTRNYINLSLLFTVLAGLAMLLIYIIRTVKIKSSLQKAEQEMRRINEQMEVANLAKDKFLSNISQSISTPLNIIVKTSSELASVDKISVKKKEELSAVVLKTTETLMTLINNILDLSRLEAGMMKFHAEKITPLSYIRLFLDTLSDRKVTITCHQPEAELEKYTFSIDTGKFPLFLTSIFTPNKEITLSFDLTGNQLVMKISGSALSGEQTAQNIIIQNEINRLLIQHFNGEYLVHPNLSILEIRLPVTIAGE